MNRFFIVVAGIKSNNVLLQALMVGSVEGKIEKESNTLQTDNKKSGNSVRTLVCLTR